MTIAEALGAGLGAIGTWVGCARDVARRLGAQIDPLLRVAGRPLRPRPADQPKAAQPAPATKSGPQVEVEESKYHLGRAAERPAPPAPPVLDREPGDLPAAYGSDRIVLLPRDPWWLFAYWEITPTTRVQALRTLGADAEGAREVLRVYDVTFITFTGDNAWLSFDVELPPGGQHWYLNVSRPAASYCAEIGLRTPSGRFLPLTRSNTVTTPRSSPSPDTTVRWLELRRGAIARDASRHQATGPATPGPEAAQLADTNGRADAPRSSDVHAPRPAR